MKFVNKIFQSSSENMKEIPDGAVDLMITSPPYNIKVSYGNKWKNRKIVQSKGMKYSDEMPEEEYIELLRKSFQESQRVLKDTGTMFINMKNRMVDGSIKTPDFITQLIPDMYLKNIIIWNFDWGGATNKRFSSRYEYVYFFSKDKNKWTFNLDDISIPSLNYRPDRYKTQFKNPSDVWNIPIVSGNSKERTEHPAQFPEKLIERIIKAASNKDEVILDPFMGSGTTAVVAKRLGRKYIGYEINKEYIDISKKRLKK
jgi:DNA modification methylase